LRILLPLAATVCFTLYMVNFVVMYGVYTWTMIGLLKKIKAMIFEGWKDAPANGSNGQLKLEHLRGNAMDLAHWATDRTVEFCNWAALGCSEAWAISGVLYYEIKIKTRF